MCVDTTPTTVEDPTTSDQVIKDTADTQSCTGLSYYMKRQKMKSTEMRKKFERTLDKLGMSVHMQPSKQDIQSICKAMGFRQRDRKSHVKVQTLFRPYRNKNPNWGPVAAQRN